MTESAIAGATSTTLLAAMLGSASNPPELAVYRGTQTPREFDARERELAALAQDAAVYDLGWQRRVAVRGEDRFRWLNGMVTNSVNGLGTHAGAWNLVLNAQGRILGDLTVWREEEKLELVIADDQFERLMEHLERFIIMDDVELVPLGEEPGAEETALGLAGHQADAVLERMGLPTLTEPMTGTREEWNGLDLRILRGYGALVPRYEIWTPAAGVMRLWRTFSTAGATPVGSEAMEAFRIAEGIPLYGIDMVEKDLPQETSQLRALHFSKGCYLGQEIVERIRSRGNVHRHLRGLELEGPVPDPGVELTIGGAQAGHITSAAELKLAGGTRVFALGMMRGEAEARNETLHYNTAAGAGTARILAEPPKLN